MITGARSTRSSPFVLDPDGLKLAVALDGDGAPWLKDLGAGRARRVEQQLVQQVAPERAAEAALSCGMGASAQTSPPKNPTRRISGPASAAPRIADAQPVEQGEVGGRDEFAAHLAAGKFRALDDGDAQALPGQRGRGGRAGRSGADDHGIMGHGVSLRAHPRRRRHG